jgi:Tfp pilus assembly protein PilN
MKPMQKQINLYQAEFRPVQVALPTGSLLLGVVVFAVGLLLVHGLDAWQFEKFRTDVDALSRQADQLEQRLARASQSIRQADPHVVAEAAQLETRIRSLEQAHTAINSGAMGSAAGYAAQFSALKLATAPGAWLTHVDISNRGHDMSLTGGALQGDAPANLIAALRRQPLFTGLTYAGLQVNPAKEGNEAGTSDAQAGSAASRPALSGAADATGSTQPQRPPKSPEYLVFTLTAQLPESTPGATSAIGTASPTRAMQPATPGATQ